MAIALYARVSTAEQAERQTVETQLQLIRGHCELHQLGAPIEFVDDGVSGAIPLENRPAGLRLLAAAQAGAISAVLIYRLDRLGRNVRVILNAIADLKAKGVAVTSITEAIDTSTSTGEFQLNVLSSVAQLERDTIAERTQAGIRRAYREGRWVCGRPPFGYLLGEDQRIHPNEICLPGCLFSPAEVVRLMYQWVGEDGRTTPWVAEELRRLHVPPQTEPGSRLNRLGLPVVSGWHASNIAEMLKQTIYRGEWVYAPKSKRGPIHLSVPALVSSALWAATRERLALGKQRLGGHNPDGGYLLTSLLVCGACGFRMNGVTQRQRGVEYQHYRCAARRERERCRAGIIPMAEADRRVWRRVVRLLEDPEQVLAAAEQELAVPDQVDERAAVEAKLVALEQEEERLIRHLRKGTLPEAKVERELADVARQRLEEEEKLRALASLSPAAWRSDAELLIMEMQRKLGSGPTPGLKREILRALVRKVVAGRESGAEWRIEWVWMPTVR